MAEPATHIDLGTQAALKGLADIAVPEPVAWMPHTWGWVALGVIVLALALWSLFAWLKRLRANRYRREALRQCVSIVLGLEREETREGALEALTQLLKRVALAAWPRPEVAALSGTEWVSFLRANGGGARISAESERWLDDEEYRETATCEPPSVEEARAFAINVRQWIERHRVSA